VTQAGIYFIFLSFVVHWHFDVKFPCSNLTVDKQFYLQKTHTLQAVLFLKVYQLVSLLNTHVAKIIVINRQRKALYR
jgi:hypothetical protein